MKLIEVSNAEFVSLTYDEEEAVANAVMHLFTRHFLHEEMEDFLRPIYMRKMAAGLMLTSAELLRLDYYLTFWSQRSPDVPVLDTISHDNAGMITGGDMDGDDAAMFVQDIWLAAYENNSKLRTLPGFEHPPASTRRRKRRLTDQQRMLNKKLEAAYLREVGALEKAGVPTGQARLVVADYMPRSINVLGSDDE